MHQSDIVSLRQKFREIAASGNYPCLRFKEGEAASILDSCPVAQSVANLFIAAATLAGGQTVQDWASHLMPYADRDDRASAIWRVLDDGKIMGLDDVAGLSIAALSDLEGSQTEMGQQQVGCVYLGDGHLMVNGRRVILTARGLIAFVETIVENGGVARTRDLEKRVNNPSRAAKQLIELSGGVLEPFLKLPGKTKNGYRMEISRGSRK